MSGHKPELRIDMSTDFSPNLAQLIEREFALGRYATEDELVAEAVRLLGDRDRLREAIDAGTRQLQNGEFTDYDSQSLRERFDQLKAGQPFQPRHDS
jgi:Arc/MetJ-type ribon-helix-helix transcriptional regulator